jgi:hypothetical protein
MGIMKFVGICQGQTHFLVLQVSDDLPVKISTSYLRELMK